MNSHAVTYYLSYSEANRTPSAVELTCADENDPCRLPNAFLSDPPLERVVAKTFEAGVRGRFGNGRWHAGAFRTTNDDDILFVSAGALTTPGFFANVGKARRARIELDCSGTAGERASWSLHYTHLEATFRGGFTIASANHPNAVDGEIGVESGDRLPLTPKRVLKAGIRFAADDSLTLGAELRAASTQFVRGDAGNLAEPLDGYAVIGVRAEYRLGRNACIFASIDNLLEEEYQTFALFGEAYEGLGDEFDEPLFVGPGASRGAFVGMRVDF